MRRQTLIRNLIPCIVAFAALSGGPLPAQVQDITGTWQGTLLAERELRVVIKISNADGGALKAVMYSIDQGSQGIPAGSITLQGLTVKMSVPSIGGAYEGKLNADGISIAGTWSQDPKPLPLNLTRATSETEWAIPAPPARPKPMEDADPAFEVAMIKLSNPNIQGRVFRVEGRWFSTRNTSLSDLITFAYGLHPRQITGGSDWIEKEKYDLVAQPDGDGQPNDSQWMIMLQNLLADRFKLTFHREQKELPVYAIVIGENGSKLTKNEDDPNGVPSLFFRGPGMLPARNATMADFASVMQRAVLDRPVVDQTGLPGRYDFILTWTPDESQFRDLGIRVPPPADNTAPDLFTAMQEQLGLRLQSTKALVDVLVIDRAENPSDK